MPAEVYTAHPTGASAQPQQSSPLPSVSLMARLALSCLSSKNSSQSTAYAQPQEAKTSSGAVITKCSLIHYMLGSQNEGSQCCRGTQPLQHKYRVSPKDLHTNPQGSNVHRWDPIGRSGSWGTCLGRVVLAPVPSFLALLFLCFWLP